MTVSIPLVALVAIVIYVAYRHMGLRVWHAIVCALLGFLIAATSAAPQIRSFITGFIQWLQSSGKA
jgi:H+/gluconate symporter-like permease